MSRDDLKKDILLGKGFTFSQATLRAEDLLESAYNLIKGYNIRTPLRRELQEILATLDASRDFPPEKKEEAEYILNEDIFCLFEELAPPGYVFGVSPGDGACFGWWEEEEE